MNLASKKCVPCKGIGAPFTSEEIPRYLAELKTEWKMIDGNPGESRRSATHGVKKISREFRFKTFLGAVAFINKIAPIAEEEGHHPDIHNYYNRVVIELWTHEVGGLSENDFILASKIEKLT